MKRGGEQGKGGGVRKGVPAPQFTGPLWWFLTVMLMGVGHMLDPSGGLLNPPYSVTKQIPFMYTEGLVCFLTYLGGIGSPPVQ